MYSLRVLGIVLLATLGTTNPVHGQVEEGQLEIRPVFNRRAGASVDVEGSIAAVGMPGVGPRSGEVLLLERRNGRWVEFQRLSPADTGEWAEFGRDVVLSGGRLAVGSLHGFVYVYRRSGRHYVLEDILRGNEGHFGQSCTLDGDTLVVSAVRATTPEQGADGGAAFVFERGAGGWTLTQRLAPDDALAGDFFGLARLQGERLLVAAPGKDGGAGAVYLFERVSGRFGQRAKLTAVAEAGLELFGTGLALDGNLAVVAARHRQSLAGAALVFRLQDGRLVHEQTLHSTDPRALDHFGFYLDLSDERLLVGAHLAGGPAHRAGAAHLFTRHAGRWIESAFLRDSEGRYGDDFGVVALEGESVLIGAPQHSTEEADAGAVFSFRLEDGSVVQENGSGINLDTLVVPDAPAAGARWRASVHVTRVHEPGAALLVVAAGAQAGALVLGGSAEWFLDGAVCRVLPGGAHGGTDSVIHFSADVPRDAGLIGVRWAAQGVVLGGSVGLTGLAHGRVR